MNKTKEEIVFFFSKLKKTGSEGEIQFLERESVTSL